MVTIQVVLDSKLLEAADRARRCTRQNRSALIRDALRLHLKQLRLQEMETRDRRGYEAQPQDSLEIAGWEQEAAWPPD